MCGRVIRTTPKELLADLFALTTLPDVLPVRYNLAPTEGMPIIRQPRTLEIMRWGLTMPEPRMAGINVRAESLAKPLYREKVKHQRCLVVVDGFYEWRKIGDKKYPFAVFREDHAPMVMAGLNDDAGCAVLTTAATGVVATIHERMPVILERATWATWIDRGTTDVSAILGAANANGLTVHPVSSAVNRVANDDPSLQERVAEPVAETPRQQSLF